MRTGDERTGSLQWKLDMISALRTTARGQKFLVHLVRHHPAPLTEKKQADCVSTGSGQQFCYSPARMTLLTFHLRVSVIRVSVGFCHSSFLLVSGGGQG